MVTSIVSAVHLHVYQRERFLFPSILQYMFYTPSGGLVALVLKYVTAVWQASFIYLAGCVLGPDGVRLLHQVLSSGAFDVLPCLPKF